MNLKFKNNFIGYFRYYYNIVGYKLVINLLLSVFIGFLDGMGLAMFIPLLQSVGDNGQVKGEPTNAVSKYFSQLLSYFGLELNISVVLFFLIMLFAFKGLVKLLQLKYQVGLRYQFIKTVRFYMINLLRNLSYSGFLKLSAGKIQSTLSTEVGRLFTSMNFYFAAAQSLLMLLTYVVLAFIANYQFAFLVALGAALSNVIYRRIYLETKKASLELSKQSVNFAAYMVQSVHHFKYLKSTNNFSVFSKMLKDVISKTENINRKMGFYGAITSAVREPLIIIIVALVIYIQINFTGAPMSSMILSLLFFYRSLSYLMIIQNNWQGFIQSSGAMVTVSEISAEMEKSQEKHIETPFTTFNEAIEIKDIEFYYGENKVLDNLSISIPKNKAIAIIGESGSGKTTLANLVAGLIEPQSGHVLLDGAPIETYNLNSFRNKIGYISQEPVIFSDNIFNNITFWAPKTPENEARFWEAIKLATLEDFVRAQPKAELSMLGDNGMLVSGGQKQRISIARELYKNAEILIMDEATSALDSETERTIQENIEKLQGSYTMVIIAHRLSTIKNVDQIYLLEKGKVAANGNFKTMLEVSPKFRHMVSLQEFATT